MSAAAGVSPATDPPVIAPPAVTSPVIAPPAETLSSAPAERVVDAPELGERVLLAIDTALGTSVALCAGGRIFESVSDDSRGHAEAIGELLSRVFEMSGARSADVQGVVAGVGPGPFTGLRVGIAAAHAFAAGRGLPVLPLQGHEAVALAALADGAAPAVRVVQDAKRRELFVTEFSGLDWAEIPVRSADPRLVARVDHPALPRVPHEVWPERIPVARLVQLASRRLAAGRSFEPDRALYLRAPDVLPAAAPKRVIP